MNPTEAAVLQKAEGGATNTWIKTKVDAAGGKMVDQFTAEAKALVAANPMGSSCIRKNRLYCLCCRFCKVCKRKSSS